VAGLLLMGWSHIAGVRKVARLEQQVTANHGEIVRYKLLAEQIKTLQAKKEALEAKLGVIQTLEKSKTGPVHILDELATRLPVQRLWLTGLDQKGDVLTVKGEALDNESIAIYMRQLGASHYIKGVDLMGAEQKERGGVKVMEFSVTCLLSLTGEGAPKEKQAPAQPGPGQSAAPASGQAPAPAAPAEGGARIAQR
jgi:type IV pilus assembly protein PilN